MPALLSSHARRLAPVALLLLLPAIASAAGAPDRGAPPVRTPAQESLQPAVPLPALPQALKVRPDAVPLTLRPAAPSGPLDRGGTFTDGAFGLGPATPNPIELAKLQHARAAVEMSRLAGTLRMPAIERAPTPLEADMAARAKMAQWNARPRTALEPFAPAGVGPHLAPLQLRGTGEMSAAERAKLDALLRGEIPPAEKAPVVKAPAPAAPAQDRKEDR